MNKELRDIALKTLRETDELLYWDLIDPILSDNATVISADENGVLEKVKSESLWMLMAKTEKKAEELTDILVKEKPQTLCVHDKFVETIVKSRIKTEWGHACYIFVRDNREPFEIETDLTFRQLAHDYDKLVSETYVFFKDDPERLARAYESIERGLFGAFLNDEIVGFIGLHSEGTMGMLEILPKFRRNGYGKVLEQYLVNVLLEKGRKPYCHVLEDNVVSIHLQKELGFLTREDKMVYWMGI